MHFTPVQASFLIFRYFTRISAHCAIVSTYHTTTFQETPFSQPNNPRTRFSVFPIQKQLRITWHCHPRVRELFGFSESCRIEFQCALTSLAMIGVCLRRRCPSNTGGYNVVVVVVADSFAIRHVLMGSGI